MSRPAGRIIVKVQAEDFDMGAELADLAAGGHGHGIGGIASFVGLVRDRHGDTPVTALTLEHYPGMTEKMLHRIADEASRRWTLDAVLVVHRYGRLVPGDRIVMTAAAAAHRQSALDACAFLIDWLKTKAPFWKLEEGPDRAGWVEARAADDRAAARWSE
jgi:molybdopterin synthase catalytic subunit